MLGKEFRLRLPFAIKRLPWLGQLYCASYCRPTKPWRTSGLLRVIFSMYYSLCRSSTGEFDYARLGRHVRIRFNARNLQFQSLYAPIFRNGYEPEVSLLLDTLLPEGGMLLDIGSNWGYFTLYAASNREKLTVHSFEPLPQSYRDLTSCVEQAGLSSMVTCHHLALSNADGEVFMQIPDGLHSGSAQVSAQGTAMGVRRSRLDGLISKSPDFIKIDVEGHEAEVLRGGVETLRSALPFLIFENKPPEVEPQKVLEPLFLLTEAGYKLFAPVVRRCTGGRCYESQDWSQGASRGDLLVLRELRPEDRLLWPLNLNVFACHEERLPQLKSKFEL
jgi:FkbM family methyltransferase